MPYASANTIDIHYEERGEGEPLVLVHGSWSDRNNWSTVVPALSESFRVIAYDRRGHGRSERPTVQGTRRDQESDLGGLIEALGIGPAHVVGTSYGSMIALGLASRQPDLVRTLTVHEPALMSLVAGEARHQERLAAIADSLESVLRHLDRGDYEIGATQFVEEIALGPGQWELLPQRLRDVMVDSAPSFAQEMLDSEWAAIDPADLAAITAPTMITQGDASPEWFYGIVATVHEAIPGSRVHTYTGGAGHAPHVTHPDDHVRAVTGFVLGAREPALAK